MKVGDKVYCNDGYGEFTGWISSIDDSHPYPYSVVGDMKCIGKTLLELSDEYNSVFGVYKLEDLTLLKDDPCQYCNLTKRELKMLQSELNDAYTMLQNRDNKIEELERKLND